MLDTSSKELHSHASTSAEDVAIEVVGVKKRFGDVEALAGVDLAVPRGKILGLLGPNGAGKTTIVNILATLLIPDAGTARIAGFDVVREAAHVRPLIGLTGQFAAIDDNLTGWENIVLVGQLYHLSRTEAEKRAKELLSRFSLADAGNRYAREYSGGMKRRLDIALSLVGKPQILFLDEPTTGLDPRSRLELWSIINDLVRDGTTILLTTQYLEEADHLADSIVVIDHGRVIARGTADELKNRVGGDVLEMHVSDHVRIADAAAILARVGSSAPKIDELAGVITVPISSGTTALITAVRELDAAGISIRDIHIRRPTLDDVFLSLTGHGSEIPVVT